MSVENKEQPHAGYAPDGLSIRRWHTRKLALFAYVLPADSARHDFPRSFLAFVRNNSLHKVVPNSCTMCYYNTYIFLGCGHISFSDKPVTNSQCPNRSLSVTPAEPSVPSCTEKLNHPLHTFGIDNLCAACQDERDARVEFFRVHIGDDIEKRIMVRSAERNERGQERGRRLFRASTTLAMMMDPGRPECKEESSRASVISTSTQEAMSKIADGFRGAVGWTGDRSHISGSGDAPVSTPGSQPSRPSTRLSFAARAGEMKVLDVT